MKYIEIPSELARKLHTNHRPYYWNVKDVPLFYYINQSFGDNFDSYVHSIYGYFLFEDSLLLTTLGQTLYL